MVSVLEPNDYFEVKRNHYDQFIDAGDVAADFSGWEFSSEAQFPAIIGKAPVQSDLNRYYADSSNRLREFKLPLQQLLCKWEERDISYDSFSVFPSTTIAMSLIMAILAERGINRIVLDCPFYFAAFENAKARGWDIEYIPPSDTLTGRLNVTQFQKSLAQDNCVVWLHQPRYSVGSNLIAEDLEQLVDSFHGNRFLVVDEANDDSFPSKTRRYLEGISTEKLFRIKSLVKSFGLNGVNLAFVMHDEVHREDLVDNMWRLGGTLDYFSLDYVRQLACPPSYFRDLLKITREQLSKRRQLIDALIETDRSMLLPATTGFLSAIRIELPGKPVDRIRTRKLLIKHFAQNRIPAMLGAHIYMPPSPGFEYVRVNLFNSELDTVYSCSVIRDFLSGSF